MRLPRLMRTSAFRLTMLYAGLFVLSVSLLFAVVSWSVSEATIRPLDRVVRDELAEVRSSAGSDNLAAMQHVVRDYTTRTSGMHYLLLDPHGAVLAGNMPPIAPVPGLVVLRGRHARSVLHGRGEMLAGGGYLFVGVDDLETPRLRSLLRRTFVASIAATIILALAGGTLMSLSVLRRVESIGRAGRDIMAGDLERRVTLRGTDDEFDQLASGLNAMLDRIQALMAGLQQVSSDIAHDLRTPLTRVRQRLELAQRPQTTPQGMHDAIGGSITDMDAILGTFAALLRIAQVQSGNRRAGFTQVNLAELAGGLVESYQPVAEERGQTLRMRSASGWAEEYQCCVNGDAELLAQMIVNLLENAIRHTPSGTVTVVSCIRRDNIVEMCVADDGPGIPDAELRSVLNRFHRLEISRSTPGDGLGLALVAAVADLHGAKLLLSDNHCGLRVALHFPGW